MFFTDDDFRTMVYELLEKNPSSYDKLCEIVNNTVGKAVKYWCHCAGLSGRQISDDIMQDLYVRFMQVTVPRFLKKDRDDGSFNDDPDGFRAWMFTVAKNFTRTKITEFFQDENRKVEIPDEEIVKRICTDGLSEETKEELQDSMDRALGYDAQIYITLSWLGQFVFVLCYGESRAEVNRRLEEEFGAKLLSDLYSMILFEAKYIPWLNFSPKQKERIENALLMPWKDGRTYGDVTYAEFSMKKGLKASISDWVNKINTKLKEEENKDESLDD